MKVLVACECSGTVRDAFKKKGHNAWSCDLRPSDTPGNHFQRDVLSVLGYGWDLMIAHPPCTYLAVSGARWMKDPKRIIEQKLAIKFFQDILNAPIEKIAVENPVGVVSTFIRPPDQYIDPIEFGHSQTKKTGLWLKNLPLLVTSSVFDLPSLDQLNYDYLSFSLHVGGKDRQKKRSKTFANIAWAMAEQWGSK